LAGMGEASKKQIGGEGGGLKEREAALDLIRTTKGRASNLKYKRS